MAGIHIICDVCGKNKVKKKTARKMCIQKFEKYKIKIMGKQKYGQFDLPVLA